MSDNHGPPPTRWPVLPANTPNSNPSLATSPASGQNAAPKQAPVSMPAPPVQSGPLSPVTSPLPVPVVAPPPVSTQSPARYPEQPPSSAPVQAPATSILPHINPPPNDTPLSAPTSNPITTVISTPNSPVNLETFRCLLGIPQDCPPLPRSASDRPNPRSLTARLFGPVRRHNHIPKWLRLQSCCPEAATSTYFAILKEESSTWRQYYFYDTFVYSALILQLCISSALVILGALHQEAHIPIAILGAVNGIITGILSLIRGQGLPNRLLQYADQLRRVREDIEWTERILRTNAAPILYAEVISLRNSYEQCRDDEVKNQPDSWNSGLSPAVGTKGSSSMAKLAIVQV
jgi:hypothetical protein